MLKLHLFRVCAFLITSFAAQSYAAEENFWVVEKLREQLRCNETSCTEVLRGHFKGASRSLISPSLGSIIDENTTVIIHVGDFHFEQRLGDDPRYEYGDTRARFRDFRITPSGAVAAVKVLLDWEDGMLKVRFKGILPYAESPLALDLVGTAPGEKFVTDRWEVTLRNPEGSSSYFSWGQHFRGVLIRHAVTRLDTVYELDRIFMGGMWTGPDH